MRVALNSQPSKLPEPDGRLAPPARLIVDCAGCRVWSCMHNARDGVVGPSWRGLRCTEGAHGEVLYCLVPSTAVHLRARGQWRTALLSVIHAVELSSVAYGAYVAYVAYVILLHIRKASSRSTNLFWLQSAATPDFCVRGRQFSRQRGKRMVHKHWVAALPSRRILWAGCRKIRLEQE